MIALAMCLTCSALIIVSCSLCYSLSFPRSGIAIPLVVGYLIGGSASVLFCLIISRRLPACRCGALYIPHPDKNLCDDCLDDQGAQLIGETK
jgi:hypothetical protein